MLPNYLNIVFLLFILCSQLTTRITINALLISPTTLNFPDSINDERLLAALRDKVIVFIGDSLTRYQYLNLAIFIERNRWPNAYDDDEELPGSVCVQPKYKDFNEFFFHTTKALGGNEMCDCWRTKSFNYENRRYYNASLNVSLVFIFLGRTMPQLRQEFNQYPFKRICEFTSKNTPTPAHTRGSHHSKRQQQTNRSNSTFLNTGDLKKCSGTVLQKAHPDAALPSHGAVLYNVTKMFQPDIAIINWGHHSDFHIIYRDGKWVYGTMTKAITALNEETNNRTRFIWKATTPACHHSKANKIMGQCNITSKKDTTPPKMVGNLLVFNKYMEMYNTHKLVTSLDHNIKILKKSSTATSETNLTFDNAMPLFFDDIHLHCWVNAELNRALLAQLFFQTMPV